MAKRAGVVAVDFIAKTASFEQGVARIDKRLGDFGKSIGTAKKLIGTFGAALAGIGSIKAFGSVVDDIDRIGKLSGRLGITTEALSKLRHAGELAGVSFDTMAMGLQRMTRRVAEAAQGTGEAKGALAELNLSAQALAQASPDVQFKAIADALNGVASQGDRVRLAMKLFDSEGVALIQTMEGGSAAIDAAGAALQRLGGVVDKDAANSAAEANNAFRALKASMEGLQIAIVKSIGPAIADIANFMAQTFPAVSDIVGRVFDGIRAVILKTLSYIFKGVQQLYELFALLPDALGGQRFKQTAEDVAIVAENLGGLAEAYWSQATGAAQAQFQWNASLAEGAAKAAQFTQSVRSAAEIAKEMDFSGIDQSPDFGPDPTGESFNAQRKGEVSGEVARLQESFMNEREALAVWFEEKSALLTEARELELLSAQDHYTLMEQLNQEHNDRMREIEANSQQNMVQGAVGAMGQMIGAFASGSKKMFQLKKILAIAEGLIVAKKAIMEAYEWGMKTGGPKVAAAYAAIAAAKQFAQLAAIKSASMGGAGGGGGGGGGGSSIGGTSASSEEAVASRGAGASRVVTINLGDDDGLISKKAVRNLIALINDEVGDGVRIIGGEAFA